MIKGRSKLFKHHALTGRCPPDASNRYAGTSRGSANISDGLATNEQAIPHHCYYALPSIQNTYLAGIQSLFPTQVVL